MTTQSKAKVEYNEAYREVKTILVSQPKPERSPYYELENKYGITIDWRPFIYVEGVSEKEFRRNRVKMLLIIIFGFVKKCVLRFLKTCGIFV
jgi:hypothetical protein